jgi:putative flippase GtrA
LRLETPPRKLRSEARLAVRHMAASGVGFAVDFAVLHLAMRWGLEPAWARVASLACAVNATFLVNGLMVFRCLAAGRECLRQWLTYLAAGAFGNLCNYWIFVTLVSLHRPVLSVPSVALCAAAAGAWMLNYASARLLVFGSGGVSPRRPSARPSQGAPGSSRR